MNKRTFNEEQWDIFINYTKDLDKLRNDNVVDAVPELKEYFVC